MSIAEIAFVGDEIRRINADTAQGEQSIMVQLDMKQWALKEGWWPASNYQDIVLGHAEARGWTQEGFTGLETY
jgi:hypothetical protein